MEDVYTIKVKTKPDTRNLYPSERRYSASTVSGLAWVHIALAATSFLLACLALVSSNAENHGLTTFNFTDDGHVARNEMTYVTGNDTTNNETSNTNEVNTDSNYILIVAPILVTIFGLAAGIASIMASVRWYIDHNITWLFIVSMFSTIFALMSFIMVIVWFVTTTEGDISDFYKDKVPFKEYFIVKHADVIDRNESHMIIGRNATTGDDDNNSRLFTKRVLSVNILIAAFLELLWSILSIKIAYKGMKSNYKDEDERRGNCISVVTTIKGNNTRKLPRNGKLLPPKPDLIEHYPNKKIKRIFLAQSDNSFYLKNQNNKGKQNTETSSEFYKERMMRFLNRCASLEGVSNTELSTPSVQSENALNPIPEVESVEINVPEEGIPEKEKDRMTPVSWGDTAEHMVYNQNNINFDKIFNFHAKKEQETKTNEKANEEISEN